ncbi:hypothetical protein SPFM12_00090 [Salmonella phage SPFM12]|nr:hypothetical protein SPFM12_00090 [Salmonella phage SPFM12]
MWRRKVTSLADIAEVCGPDDFAVSRTVGPTRRIVLSSVGMAIGSSKNLVSCNSETVSDPVVVGSGAAEAILALTQGWF